MGGQGDAVWERLWKSFCHCAQGSRPLWGTDVYPAFTSVTGQLKMFVITDWWFFYLFFLFNHTERKGQEFQKTDNEVLGVSASVSATGECFFSQTWIFNISTIKNSSCQTVSAYL